MITQPSYLVFDVSKAPPKDKSNPNLYMQEETPQNSEQIKNRITTEYQKASGVHIWVIRTFQTLIFLGLIILLYKCSTSHTCDEVAPDFNITPDTLYVNETVTFADISKYSQFRDWNFGDDSTEYETEKKTVNHSYPKEGEYFVTLRVNDKCEITKRVVVSPDRQEVIIACPRIVTVGQVFKLYDQTENSTASQWQFGDNTTGSGKVVTHKYVLEGVKTVKLTVNKNPKKTAIAIITVVPVELAPKVVPIPYIPVHIVVPEPPPESLQITRIPISPPLKVLPQEIKNIEVTKIQVEEFLMQVAENTKKADDFGSYSCSNIDFGVRANGERHTFKEFCAKIVNKKLKIKYLELQQNQHGCVIYFKIEYKASRLKGIPQKPNISGAKTVQIK